MSDIRLGVVGCGVMGTGIAHVAARAGIPVQLVKLTPGDTAAVQAKILGALKKEVEKGKLDAAGLERAGDCLKVTGDLSVVSGTNLVVESIVEVLDEKRILFARLEELLPEQATLSSNTSSLSIDDMASRLRRPQAFLGLHFFGPVPAMQLVEVVAGKATNDVHLARANELCRLMGKTAVTLGDRPGFVVNRLLVPYLLSAMVEWEQGLSSPQDIDTAMKLGCGHPMGPFALADLIGLDIVLAMAESLHEATGETRFAPPAVLQRLVDEGKLGRKNKAGFYDYSAKEPTVRVSRALGSDR